MTALVGGFFALMWFSWGGAEASNMLGGALAVGSVSALAVAALGALRAFRGPRTTGALEDPGTRRRYGKVVGIEFALVALAIVALGATGVAAYIPVLVCAVVGVHFFPLASQPRRRTAHFDWASQRRRVSVRAVAPLRTLVASIPSGRSPEPPLGASRPAVIGATSAFWPLRGWPRTSGAAEPR